MVRRAVVRRCAASLVAAVLLTSCSDDDGSAAELCEAVRAEPAIATAFTGFDPTDVERALEQLRSARVTLGELRDAAPAEVRDDLTVEIDYVQALVEALEGAPPGDPNAAVALVQQVTADHPEVAEAASNLSAFEESACG